METGEGGELIIKRANPKLYTSNCVEIFGTVQPDLSIMEVIDVVLNYQTLLSFCFSDTQHAGLFYQFW